MKGPYNRSSDPVRPGDVNPVPVPDTALMDWDGSTSIGVDGYIGPSGVFYNSVGGTTAPLTSKYPALPPDWYDPAVWSAWAYFDGDDGCNMRTYLYGDGQSSNTDRSKIVQTSLGPLVRLVEGEKTIRNAYVGYISACSAWVPANRVGFGTVFEIRDCFGFLVRNESIGYTP
jgi:hypothetical protein